MLSKKILQTIHRYVKLYYRINFIKPYWGSKELIYGFLYHDKKNADFITKNMVEKLKQKIKIKGIIIPTSSGRTALELALKVLKKNNPIKKMVITSTYGCRGIFDPIIKAGLIPIFADIDKNLNISPDFVTNLLKTNIDILAIIVPHIGGCEAEIKKIASIVKEKGIFIIEDACQALGGKDSEGYFIGTRYDMAIFSFGLGKNLMASAGGLLVSNILKSEVFAEAQKLGKEETKLVKKRFRNIVFDYFLKINQLAIFNIVTRNNQCLQSAYKYNAMHPLDAKLLSYQLDKLDAILQKRKENTQKIIHILYKTGYNFSFPNKKNHIYTKLSIIFDDLKNLNKLRNNLSKADIETETMYTPLHLIQVNF